MRNLGGISSYLSLAARCAESPETIRSLLASDQLRVVPGVRNCIWLLPAEDVPLALRVADAHYRKRSLRELSQAGVSAEELPTLEAAVLEALEHGPQRPQQLRARLPAELARSLGPAGKKRGHSTALPACLRLLEGEGRVQRRLANNELASEKLLWSLPERDPLASSEALEDEHKRAQALARRYFAWAAPATLTEFVGWSGLGKRVAGKALKTLELLELAMEGRDEPVWMAHDGLARLDASPEPEGVRLLASLDNLHALRDAPRLFCAPQHHGRELPTRGSSSQAIGELKWMWLRPLFHGSEWVGMWDWDPDEGRAVVRTFSSGKDPFAAQLEQAAEEMSRFICAALAGNAKMNSIDSESGQRKRVARLLGDAS